MTTTAGIYCRISKDRDGARAGVDRQEADCRDFVAKRGWTVGEVYVDNDLSAFSGRKRPAYARLLADVKHGQAGAIVAWHPDRLHRSPRELEDFIDLVEETGAGVATVTAGDYDLGTPDGRLMARIVGSVARKESEDKRRRLRRKHLELAEAGKVSGGRRPFGYEDIGEGDDRRRVVVEAEAELIREATERVLAGESLRRVCVEWNERGARTTTGHQWTMVAIRRILLAPRIAGLRDHLGKVSAKGAWPAIIDVAAHEELVAILNDPKRQKYNGVQARRYLLAGFIFCGLCGARCHARPRGDKRRCYVCASGPGFNGCGKIRRLADPVEELVRDAVIEALDTPALQEAVEAQGNAEGGAGLTVELQRLDERLERLKVDHHVEGLLDRDDYMRMRAELERRVDEVSAQVAEQSGARVMRQLPTGDGALRAAWDEGDLAWRRELIGLVVERVVLHPARRGFNQFDPSKIEVVWKA
jgi:site-specific DNA recombinase